MQCKSRITSEKHKQKFGDGKHYFYPEIQCLNKVIVCGLDSCHRCSSKNRHCREQGSARFDHGTIGGPYPLESHIYGSTWYLKSVNKFKEPSVHTLEILKELRNSNRDEHKVYVSSLIQKHSIMPPKIKVDLVSGKKTTVKIRRKIKDSLQSRKGPETVIAAFIEKNIEELEVDEVENVIVRKFEFLDRSYYMDHTKNKLFKCEKGGAIGPYVGRWDSVHESIVHGVDDSDSESQS